METLVPQQRITLKNLKVADFASEETLCFTATVLFDGDPIADAHNDGNGGMTFVHARESKSPRLAAASAFAESLPAVDLNHGDGDAGEPHLCNVTLDFVIDLLAEAMHVDRKMRAAFRRDIANKVLFVRDGELRYLKQVRLTAITNRPAYFAQMRARHATPIVILAELQIDEAFALWKKHTVRDH
ncbi:hypothetical protein [Paraburkholderia aspalathi]|uniref:Uncharacterized protein n=1 Tax=Paraburkholderia aspalathi TaxID=1324617 RepID=A0A1I7A969_9BURK|nr:hypothetical protein [Paraburkholderia aspalathi]SFT71452.1 hypothetical protein SAMN05192563_1003187 [Paraburkholderia aspalathi]